MIIVLMSLVTREWHRDKKTRYRQMWESCHRKAGAYSIIWSAIKVHVMYTARNYTRYVNACDGVTAPMCLNQGNRFIHSGIKYGCLIDRCLRACSTAVRTEAAPLPRLPCLRLPGRYVPLLPLLSPFSFLLLFVLPPPDHDIEQRRRAGNPLSQP